MNFIDTQSVSISPSASCHMLLKESEDFSSFTPAFVFVSILLSPYICTAMKIYLFTFFKIFGIFLLKIAYQIFTSCSLPRGRQMNSDIRKDEEILRSKIRDFFVIPSEVLPEFWNVAFQRNRISLLVICIMIFGMEIFNIARVLFMSASGLASLNNRIYFGLYCTLLALAVLYLLLSYLFRNRQTWLNCVIQYGAAWSFLVWHVLINAYDLMRNPDAEVMIYVTATLGLAIFILMPAKYALVLYGTAYPIFLILTGSILTSGDKLNLTFTTIVALATSLTSCHHHTTMISQRMEISRINEKLRFLAQQDALTGLLNKTVFQHRVESHLQEEGAVLLIMDLDDFKSVNDQYGHPCGDFVLKEVAVCIGAAFPDAIDISRIGGDEFAVLITNMTESSLRTAAQDLIQKVSEITWREQNVDVGCSIGGCRIGHTAVTYAQLYSEADRALYQAKARGKRQLRLNQLP